MLAENGNNYATNLRLSYLKSEIESGNNDVTLPILPHDNLVHDDDNADAWNFYIEKVYGEEINYRFIEWSQWYNEYYRS